jgi:hypothetical protein
LLIRGQLFQKKKAGNTMRKSWWIMLAVFAAAAVSAPNARADSFAATFTCNGTCLSTPTAPDVTFPSPAEIDVTWDGAIFDISLLGTGDLATDTYQFTAAQELQSSGTEVMVFNILDETTGIVSGATPLPILHTKTFDSDAGSLTFTAVPTPEPGSLALMLLGVGLVFVMRRQNSRGHQQAR